MVLIVNCINAMEVDTARFPEISHATRNVAPEPVIRQLIVLAKLRVPVSTKTHFLTNFCSTNVSDRFIKCFFT